MKNRNYLYEELKKISQEDMVLQHLKDFNHITSWEAFVEYGITRLSARILTLRQKGWIINTDYVVRINRYGRPVRFGKYTLKGHINMQPLTEIEI